MYVFECRAQCRTHSSIFKVCILNAELDIDPTARNLRWIFSNAELNVEPIARYSKCYGFECRAECRTHSSTFKGCMVLNAELNIDLIARYSGWIFSNAELNVKPIARYSKYVLFWMQSWTSISQLDIQDVCFSKCRAECRTHSSIFKVSMVLNAELNIEPTARNSRWMFVNAEQNVEPIVRFFRSAMILNAELKLELTARNSKCVWCWLQSWTSIS